MHEYNGLKSVTIRKYNGLKSVATKWAAPYGAIGLEYNYGCEVPTCSAVGTIYIVARDFNPWNRRYDPFVAKGINPEPVESVGISIPVTISISPQSLPTPPH